MTKEKITRICSDKNCESVAKTQGMCGMHYTRAWRAGLITLRPRAELVCSVENCNRDVKAKDLCSLHYRRFMAHNDVHYVSFILGTGDTLAESFWSRVRLTADINRCWEWQGHVTHGYGELQFDGKRWRAPKCAWFLTHGVEPTLLMLHHCDNPRCVNPNHLYEGTQRENMDDMVRRNRRAIKRQQREALAKGFGQ